MKAKKSGLGVAAAKTVNSAAAGKAGATDETDETVAKGQGQAEVGQQAAVEVNNDGNAHQGGNAIDEAVGQINAAATEGMLAWVKIGEAVNRYVEQVSPGGRKAKHDPYMMLEKHPQSIHQAGQLRNYEACYLLFIEFGGEKSAPKLPMTHFVQVLGRRLTKTVKQGLLNKALEQNLSVSELKALVKDADTDNENDSDTKGKNWCISDVERRSASFFEVLVGITGKATSESPLSEEVRSGIKQAVLQAVRLAIKHGCLSAADIALPEVSSEEVAAA